MAEGFEAAQIAASVGDNSKIQNHALVREPARLGTDEFIDSASIGARRLCVAPVGLGCWTADTSAAD